MKPLLPPVAVTALVVVLLASCAPAAPAAPAGPGAAGAAPVSKPAARQQASRGAPNADYFAGKTITMLVNYSPGGPTDTFARLLAQHLDRHIPGRPTLVVENKAGAGGLIGKNHLYNAVKKDGLTMGVYTSVFGHQLVSGEGVQYDSAGFQWLGGITETSISFANTNLGMHSMRELLNVKDEIIAGGLAPDTAKDMSIRTSLNLLGLKYKYVTGYPGSGDARLAMTRGELNYYEDSLVSWFSGFAPMAKEGTLIPLGQRGIPRNGQIVRDPRVPDIPTYNEVAVEVRGESAKQSLEYRAMTTITLLSGISIVGLYPPGVDPALVEVMRQAMTDTFADPEFQAMVDKQLGYQLQEISGAEAQELAEQIMRDAREDQEALDYLRRLSREKQ
jgi:tripartite-type tricarboxylate transporter receptor subunit TctC